MAVSQPIGAHSEIGKLRTVLTCRPGRAHERLTPSNRGDLLFDDGFWVHEARNDHHDFTTKMQERGVEVLDMHELLADIAADATALSWVLDRKFTENHIGVGMLDELKDSPRPLPAQEVAEVLTCGIAVS